MPRPSRRHAPSLLAAAALTAVLLGAPVAGQARPAGAPAGGHPRQHAGPATAYARPLAAAPTAGTFVAALSRRPALNAGIVTDGRRVLAYVCDEGTRSVWFAGRFAGRTALLRARRGGRGAIRLRRSGRALVGTVRLGRRTYRLRALRARSGAGVFRASVGRADGTSIEAAWIVLRRGRQTGAAVSGASVDAPPILDPDEPTVRLGGVDLRPIELDPGLLLGLEVSPGVITIDPTLRGDPRLLLRRSGLTRDARVEIDGQPVGAPGPSGEPDAIVVRVPSTLAAGCHDVTVRPPQGPVITKRDAFRVVIAGAPQPSPPTGGFPCPSA